MERKVDIEKLRRKNKKRKAIKKLPSPEITKANLDIWSTVNIKINLFLKMAAIAITIAIIIFIWIDNKIINFSDAYPSIIGCLMLFNNITSNFSYVISFFIYVFLNHIVFLHI